MKLKDYGSNGSTGLIFINSDLKQPLDLSALWCNEDTKFKDLPREGWKFYVLKSLHLLSNRNVPDVICKIGDEDGFEMDIIRMCQSLHPIYQGVQASGGLPFHAGLVEWNSHGVLLAAPGNTEKSTCCSRLPHPWHALCDDEALIVHDEHKKRYLAHPFPTWSDYIFQRSERTWDVQRHVPLSAIFFLEQSETDEVVRIGEGQAYRYLSTI